ncbi:MAG: epoxyqueuosine reductase QueH [Candidatus Omnitrophica bacterium]|nr:epoxyqueuosine reductase QueH [Candidatus Omnitrophota bacterium]
MKILLHVCCAPCLIYPLKRLNDQGFKVKGFYYNPNIHPVSEYNRRKEGVVTLSAELQIELDCPDYLDSEFYQAIGANLSAPDRCRHCWKLRLERTALHAKQNGFDAFSSTLLVSPYQNQESLKILGAQAGEKTGVKFHYEDFRAGFRLAHEEARSKGIYCQKYCGCSYSEAERKIKVKK